VALGCAAETGRESGGGTGGDTVFVAAPTGVSETDRGSIEGALGQVEPGGTVLFAPGLYRLGPMIRVDVPRVTLLGHPGGTTLRGCDPEEFVGDPMVDALACHGLELAAPEQTVRGLTIEYSWHGLFVGCCFPSDLAEMESGESQEWDQPGGHVIEGNTFRYSPNGLRVIGELAAPAVVRGNRFIDVYHAIGINGGPVHFLDNDMLVREPQRVPVTGYPGDVINVLPFAGPAYEREDHSSCRGNRIEGNRIDGYPDGIAIRVWDPGTSCRENTIRNNSIRLGRVVFRNPDLPRVTAPYDSTLVGVPIRLENGVGDDSTALAGTIVEGNEILGAQGLAIALEGAFQSSIVGNRIVGVVAREPFPGNTVGIDDDPWRHANGSGIWISMGSSGNQILDNTFEDVAAFSVVVDGNDNVLAPVGPRVRILDRGSRNRCERINGERNCQ
jgi:hypothetical protein